MLPGDHLVVENTPKGWVETSVVCSHIGDSVSSGYFNLGPGDVETCTFTDTQNATVIITKNVISSVGGGGTFDFTGSLAGPFSVTTSGATGSQSFTQNVIPGTYSVSELVPKGWTLTGTSCNGENTTSSINAVAGKTTYCTFTDTQNVSITVIKNVLNCPNCGGGLAVPSDFVMNVIVNGNSIITFPGANVLGTTVSVIPGTFQVTESPISITYNGYLETNSGQCYGFGQPGKSYTCTIQNRRVPPVITVYKNVIGGTAVPSDFTLQAQLLSSPANTPSPFPGSSAGTEISFSTSPATYNVVELEGGPAGYIASYSSGCSGTLDLGQTASCTVNNIFDNSTVTIFKFVNNTDLYGDLAANDFTINVISNGNVVYSGPGNPNGVTVKLPSGTFQVVESDTKGYLPKIKGTCYGSATYGQTFTCTITNCDQPSYLTVIKNVIGGDAVPSDFVMNVTNIADPSPFAGASGIGTTIPIQQGFCR